jgi:hypothetical protein
MVLLNDDKKRLADMREMIRERLVEERLQLHPNKAHITPTRDGLNLLGYFVYPRRRLLRNDNGYRFARKFRDMAKAYAVGLVQWSEISPRIQSWVGHAKHADADGLRRKIFSQAVFTGERAKRRPACNPRRFLEQQTGEPAFIEPEQEQCRQPQQQHRLSTCPVRPHGKLPGPEPVCSRTDRVRQRVSMSLFPGLPF